MEAHIEYTKHRVFVYLSPSDALSRRVLREIGRYVAKRVRPVPVEHEVSCGRLDLSYGHLLRPARENVNAAIRRVVREWLESTSFELPADEAVDP